MSAFQVSPAHLLALVSVSIHGPRDAVARWYGRPNPIGTDRAYTQSTFAMLAAENARSVAFRYRETIDPVALEHWHKEIVPTLAEALALLDCYEYQSCECDDWEASNAAKWCARLRRDLCKMVQGYSAASWTI